MRSGGGGFAATVLPAGRHARLRGGPPTQSHGQEQAPLSVQPRGAQLVPAQIPLHTVSTVSGDCQPMKNRG